jgi:pimeloyl-ACP methyl ester carboxylesterase
MHEAMDVEVSGEGTPLVAVHGIQGTRAAWAPVAHLLAHKHRFVLPNLRGRGSASRGAAPQDYSLDRLADDLAAAIDRHVGRHRYVLAGWSLGAHLDGGLCDRPAPHAGRHRRADAGAARP